MPMQIIDGKYLSGVLKEEIKQEVEDRTAKGEKRPHLAAVLIGDNPASRSYVKSKVRSCEEVGIKSTLVEGSNDITEEELLAIVKRLNEDEDIDGFIVQLPLPKHIDEQKINLSIDPKKDVDGFHPTNVGRMAIGLSAYLPATPMGILTMLSRYQIQTEGKECVILGRSNIVGMPMAVLMSKKANPGNATVTLCHSRTKNLDEKLAQADIIIAAIGRPHFVKEHMVKEGAVVIDVGINRIDDPTRKRGYRLVGDVDYDAVASKCSYITPVPGGVGPMTVVSLLANTLRAANKEVY